MEKKQILSKALSIILSLVFAFSIIVEIPAAAIDNGSTTVVKENGTPGFYLPYNDPNLNIPNKLMWKAAGEILNIVMEHEGNDTRWHPGYFHAQVEEAVRNRYKADGFLDTELYCSYSETYSDGKTSGFADLAQVDGNTTYIWEVKPYVYLVNSKLRRKTFEEQLDRYINSDPSYKNGCKSSVVIKSDTIRSVDDLFDIDYRDAGNGMIVYTFSFDFDRIKSRVPDFTWIYKILPLLQALWLLQYGSDLNSGSSPAPAYDYENPRNNPFSNPLEEYGREPASDTFDSSASHFTWSLYP